jgi:cellulose synthase/poly-beta-1,6-N-acetylglucosamine synthase-like glycosyltransferase
MAIEDPEVGMRLWKNGKRLGVIEEPLIEEAPITFARGVTQRKRWICGFFQSLTEPLDRLDFTPWERVKAWLQFLPCLSLWINAIGFPTGVWAIWTALHHEHLFPHWIVVVAGLNVAACAFSLSMLYVNTWRRTGLVLDSFWQRVGYMLRINPLFLAIWWTVWLIPLAIGFWMYLRDRGHVWERTEKINANQTLIEVHYGGAAHNAQRHHVA